MRYWILLGGLLLAPAGHAALRVTDVAVSRDAKGWRVDVKASAKAAYTVHSLPSPNRLIIDVPGATLGINSQVKPVSTAGGPALRFSQFTRKPDSVRVVVDLPGDGKWYEISASPAMSIAVLLPPAARAAPAIATAPAKRTPAKPAPAKSALAKPSPKAPRTGKAVSKPVQGRPSTTGPTVLSARELEREILKAGGPAKKAAAKSTREAARPPAPPRKAPRTSTRSKAPAESRSSVTSRAGSVDRTDLMATMLSLPVDGMALPPVGPVAPPEPPEPAWTQEEAVALINASECPDTLRRRLIEIVSDPAIQTSQYAWGAETPGQFDCSGLMLYIYSALNVKLPRVSLKQAEFGTAVDRADLRAGDLLFFNTRGKDISHVGIYLGNGSFLHAANPRENLRITTLDSPYYAKRFVSARRVYAPAIANSNIIRQGG